MSTYSEDIRILKRTKAEAKAPWLIWRKGKFSPNELELIKRGLDDWVSNQCEEQNTGRDEVLSALKWARENKLTAWCDIENKCGLPDRKIGAIRHCILRRYLPGSETDRWTVAQTSEFVKLQGVYGPRAWKQIAQETGRTLEDVVNKGRVLELNSNKLTATRFARQDSMRLKLAKLLKHGSESYEYEFHAIRPDCELVAYIRRYMGGFPLAFGIPNGKIARRLHSAPELVRMRWHNHILPEVISRVSRKLDDRLIMDDYLVLQARKACRGKLVDASGTQIFPAVDWYSLDFKALVPLWPAGLTETRLRHTLRNCPKLDILPLSEVVEAAMKVIRSRTSKSTVNEAASRHFDELRCILNALANRGDEFIAERKHAAVDYHSSVVE